MLKLDEVKQYLRIDHSDEDVYLSILIILSREICENYIRQELPRRIPESIKQAQLIICGYFYENREGTKDGIPSAVFALLNPYRKAVF